MEKFSDPKVVDWSAIEKAVTKKRAAFKAFRDVTYYLVDNEHLAKTSTEAAALLATIVIKMAKEAVMIEKGVNQ